MNARTDFQIIKDGHGKPAFVVVPYDQFQRILHPVDKDNGVPAEVVDLAFENNRSALWAWRENLGLTQQEMAARLSITQAAYSQHESKKTLRKATRIKMARALGINEQQLDF